MPVKINFKNPSTDFSIDIIKDIIKRKVKDEYGVLDIAVALGKGLFGDGLEDAANRYLYKNICEIADEAVVKFAQNSPTEEIANNWSYEIEATKHNQIRLCFNNSTIQNGQNVAIIIDVGHGTRDGNWVEGKNYLDQPTQEAYDKIINEIWEALKNEHR